MASAISSVVLSRKPLVSPAKVSTPVADSPETPVEVSDNFNTKFLLGKTCRDVLKYAQEAATSLQMLPINEEHVAVLTQCSRMILQVPFRLPQYFFVSLQQTNVKLALSPPLPLTGQYITVTLNTHLSLKVEGVIEHSGKTRVHRTPSAVYVQVVPSLEKPLASDIKAPELTRLERTELVKKDYFQAQFLLSLPVRGYYTVQITASLLDHEDTLWQTGPKTTMPILVDTDEGLKQRQQQQQRQKEVGSAMPIPGKSMHGHRV